MPSPSLKKTVDVRLPETLATSSFKLTPYKTCLYLLLLELEKKQDKFTNDRRSYYSFCMWTLISQQNLSLPVLKCYVYEFMNDFQLFDVFVSILSAHHNKEILPDSEHLLFNQKTYPKFVKPLSIIGFFVRNFEMEFLLMDTEKRFKFMRQWTEYLNETAADDEISTLSKEWNIDLNKLLKSVEEAESKIETKRPQTRSVVPAELDLSF